MIQRAWVTRGIVCLFLMVGLARQAPGQKGLRFDVNRGVRGQTEHKRHWLDRAFCESIQDQEKLALARQRLKKMSPAQVNVLANQLFAQQLRRRFDNARFQGGFHAAGRQGAGVVGFAPVITWLPEGVNMGARAVISPDRRHVRVTTSPFFSSIPSVDTFNFVTGRTTRYYYPQRQPGWNHMPPPPPSARVETWHDGLRTRTVSRPPRERR